MRGTRPNGFPQLLLRGNESRVTALSKIAVSRGNPMLFSVPKRTADVDNRNSIGAPPNAPSKYVAQYTDNLHAAMRQTCNVFALRK
jgi:hypothetical protein